MALNLRGRDFLTLRDFTPEEIIGLLDLAADYKKRKNAESASTPLRERTSR